jgi:hypothetical protein
MSEIHLYDINTRLTVILTENGAPVDISTATVKTIILQKPNGAVLEKTALFTTTGTDGSIYYITVANDLDQSGVWYIQARVTFGGGTWSSQWLPFTVMENLPIIRV